MGWYYDYRPYVSVAQRRQQAMREIEKRRKKGLAVSPVVISGRIIARTFWGKAWCENLESYSDFANRLPRGRTYARNGSVVHLEIHPGKISALVSGSELYEVDISISALPGPHWKRVRGECAGKIGSLVELLQGRLSQNIMDVVTQREAGLFPKPAEIEMECSCPDWAGMCKHVAAVMYGIGARLDERPDLLFVLRKVDHLELIAGAVESVPAAKAGNAQGKKTIAAGELADVFGIELAEGETARDDQPAISEKPVNPGIGTPEKKPKRVSKPASAKTKQAARALAAKKSKPKSAKVHAQASKRSPRKTVSRKRTKHAVS
jgi:uncharacterized Zn finger protein